MLPETLLSSLTFGIVAILLLCHHRNSHLFLESGEEVDAEKLLALKVVDILVEKVVLQVQASTLARRKF